jgi:hypothetical protein
MAVRSQPRQIVHETLALKKVIKHTQRVGGVTQGVGPEFKSQYYKRIKKKKKKRKNVRRTEDHFIPVPTGRPIHLQKKHT